MALKNIFLLFFAECEMIFLSGIMYGLNGLAPMLLENGLFDYVCNEPSSNHKSNQTCQEQYQYISYAMLTVFVTYSVMGCILGLMLDRFGPKVIKIIGFLSFYFACGTLYITFAYNSDWLFFISVIFFSIVGVSMIITNVLISSLFVHYKSFIVALFNGSFDASGGLIVLITLIYDMGVELQYLFYVFTIFGSLIVTCSLLTYACNQDINILMDEDENQNAHLLNNEKMTSIQNSPIIKVAPDKPWKNRLFIFHLVFSINLFFRFSYYLAKFSSEVNKNYPDLTEAKYILKMSNYFFLLGLLVAPLVGFITDYTRRIYPHISMNDVVIEENRGNSLLVDHYKANLHIFLFPTLLCCVSCSLVSLFILIPYRAALFMSVAFFIILRSTIFPLITGVLLEAFYMKHFGKLFGLCSLVPGLFSLIQYAMITNNAMSTIWIHSTLFVFSLFNFGYLYEIYRGKYM